MAAGSDCGAVPRLHERQAPGPFVHRIACVVAVWLLGTALCAPAAGAEVAPPAPKLIAIDATMAGTPVGAALAEAQDAFRNALGNEPERTVAMAKVVVQRTAEAFGGDHANVGLALTNLAIVQADARIYEDAIENYVAAIATIERAAGTPAPPELADPLRGLADAYMAVDAVELAIPLYERAVLVTQINDGPASLNQIPAVQSLSRAWFVRGKPRRAASIQETIYRLQQRNADDDSDAYVDALMQRASWYEAVGDFFEASKSYKRAADVLKDADGDMALSRIEPLLAYGFTAPQSASSRDEDNMAVTAWDHDVTDSGRDMAYVILEAERAMKMAVRIARRNEAATDELLARTLVARGDWATLLNSRKEAWRAYREAWALLNADPELHELRDTFFSKPVLLYSSTFDRVYKTKLLPAAREAAYPERGSVEATFNVSIFGRPINVEVQGDPAGLMDGQVRGGLPTFVYRPAFADGKAITYEGVTFRHQFRYNPKELSERELAFIEGERRKREAVDAAQSARPTS